MQRPQKRQNHLRQLEILTRYWKGSNLKRHTCLNTSLLHKTLKYLEFVEYSTLNLLIKPNRNFCKQSIANRFHIINYYDILGVL